MQLLISLNHYRFLGFITSKFNKSLSKEVLSKKQTHPYDQNESKSTKKKYYISYDTSFMLLQLLEKEFKMIEDLITLSKEILKMPGFNYIEAFCQIDKYENNYIDEKR